MNTNKRPRMKFFRQDPPGQGVGRPLLWADRLKPLMAEPGVWYNCGEHSAGITHNLKRHHAKHPNGRWEFTTRRGSLRKGRATLYVRYLGPVEAEQATDQAITIAA